MYERQMKKKWDTISVYSKAWDDDKKLQYRWNKAELFTHSSTNTPIYKS